VPSQASLLCHVSWILSQTSWACYMTCSEGQGLMCTHWLTAVISLHLCWVAVESCGKNQHGLAVQPSIMTGDQRSAWWWPLLRWPAGTGEEQPCPQFTVKHRRPARLVCFLCLYLAPVATCVLLACVNSGFRLIILLSVCLSVCLSFWICVIVQGIEFVS